MQRELRNGSGLESPDSNGLRETMQSLGIEFYRLAVTK